MASIQLIKFSRKIEKTEPLKRLFRERDFKETKMKKSAKSECVLCGISGCFEVRKLSLPIVWQEAHSVSEPQEYCFSCLSFVKKIEELQGTLVANEDEKDNIIERLKTVFGKEFFFNERHSCNFLSLCIILRV